MMIEAIGGGLTAALGWLGDVVSAFTTPEGAFASLLTFLGVGIGIKLVLLGTKVVRKMIWGA